MSPLLLMLLLQLPLGAEPEVEIPVGASATVRQMPRIHPQVAELIMKGVAEDITPLRRVRTPQIDEIGVVSHGGGEWMVRMYLIDPDTHLVPEVNDGMLVLAVMPGATPSRAPVPDAPSVDALLENAVEAGTPDEIPAMFFLHGAAQVDTLDPQRYPLRLGEPDWLVEDPGGWHRLQEDRLDYLRTEDCLPSCAAEHAEAAHALGWRYINMGWGMEGRHYLDRLPLDNPAVFSPLQAALGQARAAMEVQDWDTAGQRLQVAWDLGAPVADVVEAIGLISLASGVPARGPTGRLLANVTAEPHAQLLAAHLLQMETQLAETLPILETLPEQLRESGSADLAAKASLWHGDALLLDGRIDEARRAWQQAEEPLKTFRDVYAEVYRAESENWIALMPRLLDWTQEGGPRAAEALHLIAQIDESMGIEVDAIAGYAEFVDAQPDIAARSDVPARLWGLYTRRVHALHDAEKWYALAAVHESAWRDVLFDEIDDPAVLWEVSQAYEALGLHRKALDVLSTGFARMISDGLEHPEMTLNLARLYEKLSNDRDGLKTIDFLREMSVPDSMAGEVALMRGRMLLRQGDEAAAVLELQQARRVPGQRDEASLTLALIDARRGQCDRAVSPLKKLLLSDDSQTRWTESEPYLELTRCAADLGDRALAAEAALAAAERSVSPDEARYAGYLHQLYSDPGELPEILQDGEDIWATLGRARVEQDAFQDTIDDRLRR